MASRGTRYINGREYLLCGRYSSKVAAQSAAESSRERWYQVRIIKVNQWDFMIYVHGAKP